MKKEMVDLALSDLCVKCCVKFGFWLIAKTKEMSIAVNTSAEREKAIINFGPSDEQIFINRLVSAANIDASIYKQELVKLIHDLPDCYPDEIRAAVYEMMIREIGTAKAYCQKGAGHNQLNAIKFNLRTRKAITEEGANNPIFNPRGKKK